MSKTIVFDLGGTLMEYVGMPDHIFKPAIEKILPYFDLYVSSQICGVRKPNKGGISYIANAFQIRDAEILFVGDEEKDFLTALNAGCDFAYINDFLKNMPMFLSRY